MGIAEDIYTLLQTGEINCETPVYRATDLADALDVTDQTIRNNIPKVEKRPGVEKGTIGKAQVWWFDANQARAARTPDLDDLIGQTQYRSRTKLLTYRAQWLDLRQKLKSEFRAGNFADQLQLAALWHLDDYLWWGTSAYVNWSAGVYPELLRQERDLIGAAQSVENLDESRQAPRYSAIPETLTEEELDYYTVHAHCFTTRGGEDVVGLGEYITPYATELKTRLMDDNETIERPFDPTEYRSMLPIGRSVLALGETVDEFVTELQEINW